MPMSRTQLIHPTPSGAANPPCRPRKALSPRFGLSFSWAGKRNLAGRDWRAISGAECGRTAGIRFADRDTPRYRTEIARVFVYRETASVCRDCMVADAVLRNRSAEAEFCRKCQISLIMFFWGVQTASFRAFRNAQIPVFIMC